MWIRSYILRISKVELIPQSSGPAQTKHMQGCTAANTKWLPCLTITKITTKSNSTQNRCNHDTELKTTLLSRLPFTFLHHINILSHICIESRVLHNNCNMNVQTLSGHMQRGFQAFLQFDERFSLQSSLHGMQEPCIIQLTRSSSWNMHPKARTWNLDGFFFQLGHFA